MWTNYFFLIIPGGLIVLFIIYRPSLWKSKKSSAKTESIDDLIDEFFFRFSRGKDCAQNFEIRLKIDTDEDKRIFSAEEMVFQMRDNTAYGKYFRDIIIKTIPCVITRQGEIINQIEFYNNKNGKEFDVLYELVKKTSFGYCFNERIISSAIIIAMGAFVKIN